MYILGGSIILCLVFLGVANIMKSPAAAFNQDTLKVKSYFCKVCEEELNASLTLEVVGTFSNQSEEMDTDKTSNFCKLCHEEPKDFVSNFSKQSEEMETADQGEETASDNEEEEMAAKTATPSPPCTEGWTEFFNVAKLEDHPDKDDVAIENLRKVHDFCSEDMIADVECKVSVDGQLVDCKATKHTKAVNCSPQQGLHCHRKAVDEDCYDYSIRFYCSCPATTTPVYTGPPTPEISTPYTGPPTATLPPRTTTTYIGAPTTEAPCSPGWTAEFNVQDPKENPDMNDNETIAEIRKFRDFCSNDMIKDIKCMTRIDGQVVDYREAGQVDAVKCSPLTGLTCDSSKLEDEECHDYAVKFFCTCTSTTPKPVTLPPTGPTTYPFTVRPSFPHISAATTPMEP